MGLPNMTPRCAPGTATSSSKRRTASGEFFFQAMLTNLLRGGGAAIDRLVSALASGMRPIRPPASETKREQGSGGEGVPDDHAGAGAPGDGGHVGEHFGGARGECEGDDPREELRRAARAGRLHPLQRALAQQGLVVALLQEIEEPEVEL